jgi:hypothetical protein
MSSEEEDETRVVLDGGLWHPVAPLIAVTVYVALTVWAEVNGELARVQNDIRMVGDPGFQVFEVGVIVVVLGVVVPAIVGILNLFRGGESDG